jgi:CHAT domain-containing protein
VETVSAKQLVVGVFDALAKEPGLTRSAALQRSMLKVMAGQSEDGFSYAHPLFWAPYALVGDGGI